jgi:CheY-like chemotaxis protein
MPKQILKRILYVEDEPDIRTVTEMALNALGGFNLEVCCDGFEAVKKGPGFEPDLMILDVMMPGMDGPSTMNALRKFPELSDTPVVFMTAKIQTHEVEKYLKMGAAGVISKPFDPMTLAQDVQDIWDKQV